MTISLLTLTSPSGLPFAPAPASTSPNSTSYSRPGISPKIMITPSSVLSSIRINTRWVGTPLTVTASPFVFSASPTIGRRFTVAGLVDAGCVEVDDEVKRCLPLRSSSCSSPSSPPSSVPHDPRSIAISSSIREEEEVEEEEEARMNVTETEVISRRTR